MDMLGKAGAVKVIRITVINGAGDQGTNRRLKIKAD